MWLDFSSLDDVAFKYANSLGKALALAQSFEENRKFVLLIANLGHEAELGKIVGLSDMRSYSERLDDSFTLGRDIDQFRSRHKIDSADMTTLRAGKDARKFIAHEAAHPLLHGRHAARTIIETMPLYSRHVQSLAAAENLISCWSFEIQEKAAPPPRYRKTYAQDAAAWVLYEMRGLENGS